ncbi:MAG: GNAT family N-acetyltransferase [Rhodopseudomonas sp.]|uniref:GNAT family N-acetyltransferase n=1 Tax=Rhodopseudomonas sp. TaxID=1078 RepID=UPI0039E5D0C6
MDTIDLVVLCPEMPELAICASWRAEAFGVLKASPEQELLALRAFTADQRSQVALVARHNGRAAGTCLLVPSEIDPNHAVTPWLAGLYVEPAHRRHGVGAALVHGIQRAALQRGHRRLFLYTHTAVGFYQSLGWTIADRTDWNGRDTALMAIDL